MNKRTMKLGWLVMAAALTIGMTACTNDDNIADEQTKADSTVHVTVGAGIGDGTTRAAVTQEGTTRTLTFTTGDRIYVNGSLPNDIYVVGYLDMDGSPSADGKSASFSGDLTVYDKQGAVTTYNFTNVDDPLADCTSCEAVFIPVDAPEGFFGFNKYKYLCEFYQKKCIADDVNTLMRTSLFVLGDYNSTTKTFNLIGGTAVLNCVIGHLSKEKEYSVVLRMGYSQYYYETDNNVSKISYVGTVTTDANGVARFAIGTYSSYGDYSVNRYYVLQLKRNSTTREYILGQKELSAKVYNVKRDNYALCNFTVNVPGEEVGGVVGPGSCDDITITDGNGHTYSTSAQNMDLTFENGQTNFPFQMEPVTDATLTITGTRTSPSATYVGTIEHVTLDEFGTYNFGPVNLVKQ